MGQSPVHGAAGRRRKIRRNPAHDGHCIFIANLLKSLQSLGIYKASTSVPAVRGHSTDNTYGTAPGKFSLHTDTDTARSHRSEPPKWHTRVSRSGHGTLNHSSSCFMNSQSYCFLFPSALTILHPATSTSAPPLGNGRLQIDQLLWKLGEHTGVFSLLCVLFPKSKPD